MLQFLRALEDFGDLKELEEIQRCCPDSIAATQNLDWPLRLRELVVTMNRPLPETLLTPTSLDTLLPHLDAVAASWSHQSIALHCNSLQHTHPATKNSLRSKHEDSEWLNLAVTLVSDSRDPLRSEERDLASWFGSPSADDALLNCSTNHSQSVLEAALSDAGLIPLPSILAIGSSLSEQLNLLGRLSGISSSAQIRIEEPSRETLVIITAALQERGFGLRLPCPSPLYCPVTGIRLSSFSCEEAFPSILSCGHILSAKAVQQLLAFRSRREPALRECLACPYCSATCAKEVICHITLI
jgi:hypothetical protein